MKRQSLVSFVVILLACSFCKHGGGEPVNPPPFNPPADTLTVSNCGRCLVLAEQSGPAAIRIVDIDRNRELWLWDPFYASDIQDANWFTNPDEVKPVYNNTHVLITASGGGVALIRISDKKVMFHAFVGGNPHSAELLPDGNLVTASSTGNYLRIFHVDTLQAPDEVYSKKIPIPFGHNVVWDKQRELLWSAGEDMLYAYKYNFNCTRPDLTLTDSLQLPGRGAHDLFPVHGEDALWLTLTNGVYTYSLQQEEIHSVDTPYQQHIKSLSSGPGDYPTAIIKPKEQWWTDEVIDLQGNSLFLRSGYKIYKARWWLHNTFSYPKENPALFCK